MTVTHYFWDPVEDNVFEEYDENGDTIVEYETEPDLYGNLISQERDGVTSYYHFDGQGSTLALTNKDGDVTDECAYNAFGETTELSGATENSRRYVGEKGYQYDAEISAYHVRERDYEPAIARWRSADPIGFGDGVNVYLYVRNNPGVFVDASSLARYVWMFEGAGGDQVNWLAGRGWQAHRLLSWLSPSNIYSLVDPQFYVQHTSDRLQELQQIITNPIDEAECPPKYDTLLLVGYSWGGAAVVRLLGQLKSLNIKTDAVLTIDPVPNPYYAGTTWDVNSLEGSYGAWQNYYQHEDNLSLAAAALRRAEPIEALRRILTGESEIWGRSLSGAGIRNVRIRSCDFCAVIGHWYRAYGPFGHHLFWHYLPNCGARLGHLGILRVLYQKYRQDIIDFVNSVGPTRPSYKIKED